MPINNMASKILFDSLSIPKKLFKWDYLSRKNILIYICKLVEHYKLLAINDIITLDSSVNQINPELTVKYYILPAQVNKNILLSLNMFNYLK